MTASPSLLFPVIHVYIHQLQQENASLRKQVSSEPTLTANSSPPSESTLPSSKRPRSPSNDAAPPTTKVSKVPNPKPKHSLDAIARQFSSPTAPSSFTFIHVPIHRRLPSINSVLTFVSCTLTHAAFWIFNIQIEMWPASLSIPVSNLSSIFSCTNTKSLFLTTLTL
ncbi:hypothetical protein RO3G_12685 [Rhizopus delemar RA 99-880]|uniref:Uncharacterized protein n=1 Tax=Rhizopus delemar (strain RA 99-880 / ATCC MYA-4621 / FGSC 9543 / NRRL 43880) TaxID=246409 RepID=I1CHP4_RHIO9|nr:hypothetical protein RO3G_12685 [Rhizopus delemar RA 99-880]|eukprot:EIE87974.1 hypothetical protein RO3G_12685 [Rhizopus delemar RA 99-880]